MSVLQRCSQAAGRWQNQVAHLFQKQAQQLFQKQDLAPSWVFLGPPGVGKGTYCSRISEALGIPHIAAGDLVRDEISNKTDVGLQAQARVLCGDLLPDSLIFQLMQQRLERGQGRGEEGVLLDGFPRTLAQAEGLTRFSNVQLAINLHIDEQILIDKCLGRRVCKHCKRNYNVAEINIPAAPGQPAIYMPPLTAPPECEAHLMQRADDNLDTVLHRLQVYKEEAQPVEEFFRRNNLLLDFEITGGIPETLPRLSSTLEPYVWALQKPRIAQAV